MKDVADTATRTLQLLTLLQRRRYWPGLELAARLEISERTLRRDVDRLRQLGYTIGSDRGVDGGYQLLPGPGLAPLLLDDNEAVALAVSLHLAAREETDLAEAAVSALAKVLSILPPTQRRQAEDVVAATATGPNHGPPAPSAATLTIVARACRDGVRLSFSYQSADGSVSERYVEPCRLVALNQRWYLVAFDDDRNDWRTFRIDRITRPEPTRTPFPPREPPADDLHAYVRSRLRDIGGRHHVVIEIAQPADRIEARWGRWVSVTPMGPEACRLTVDVDTFDWPLFILATVDSAFAVVEPTELRHHIQRLADRFSASIG